MLRGHAQLLQRVIIIIIIINIVIVITIVVIVIVVVVVVEGLCRLCVLKIRYTYQQREHLVCAPQYRNA